MQINQKLNDRLYFRLYDKKSCNKRKKRVDCMDK